MRIFFTGGSGKAGQHVTRHLANAGHRVTNADLTPLGADGIDDLTVDVTDRGAVASALGTYADLSELSPDGPPRYDAVVHFAAYPRIGLTSDVETFRANTQGTYNVVEAALERGIPRVVIASSETTYGICFAGGEVSPDYLPVDEDHPTRPEDSYALAKVCNEETAMAFARRGTATITALRIGNVIEPHEYGTFRAYVDDPSLRRRNLFNYVDARDLARLVELVLGRQGAYRVYNAGSGNSVDLPAPEIARRFFPSAEVRETLRDDTAIYSYARAEADLGYRPQIDWRAELRRAEGG